MDRITQEAYHRQRIIKWAAKKGVTEASIRYRVSRKTIYKWQKRYDGSIDSLKDRSRRPHHSPRQQSEQELKLVGRYGKHLEAVEEAENQSGSAPRTGNPRLTGIRMGKHEAWLLENSGKSDSELFHYRRKARTGRIL